MTDRELLEKVVAQIDKGFNDVKNEIKDVKSDVIDLKNEVKDVKSDVIDLKNEVKDVKSDVNGLKNEVKDVKSDVNAVRNEMQEGFKGVYTTIQDEFNNVYAEFKDIQITLENETNKNIQLIAEGHFNLSCKLDDALKVEREKELMLIRLTRLENDVRRLKARIEETA